MDMIVVLLILYVIGLPVTLLLGNKNSSTAIKLALGTFVWVVMTGILSYTKNLPSSPFLGIAWLKSAYVPLIMVFPFYLYKNPKYFLFEIYRDLKQLAIISILLFTLSLFWKPAASPSFSLQVQTFDKLSLIAPYQGVNIVDKIKITDYGSELLVNNIGEIIQSASAAYRDILSILLVSLMLILLEIFEKLKIDWRMMIGIGSVMITLVLRLVIFADVLTTIVVFSGWLMIAQLIETKSFILAGVALSGLLSIHVGATLWWVIPSLLVFRPKELVASVGIATLINPLLIGTVR